MTAHGLAQKMGFKNANINREISKRWEMIKLKTKIIEQLYELEILEEKVDDLYMSHSINNGLKNSPAYNTRKDSGHLDWKKIYDQPDI